MPITNLPDLMSNMRTQAEEVLAADQIDVLNPLAENLAGMVVTLLDHAEAGRLGDLDSHATWSGSVSAGVELVALVGGPASGKSTWARQWVERAPGRRARVCPDELRSSLFGVGDDRRLSPTCSAALFTATTAVVREVLLAGVSVVVDEHATPNRREAMQQMANHFAADYREQWMRTAEQDRAARDAAHLSPTSASPLPSNRPGFAPDLNRH